MADVTKIKIADGDSNGLVVCLGGILMRAEAYKPLVSTLAPHGDVIGFDYDPTKRMNMPELLIKVRQAFYEAQSAGRQVTLIGSSMGGMQVPFVVEDYRRAHAMDDLTWLRKVVIVDAPTGAKTMKALPDFAAGLLASGAGRRLLGSSLGDKLVATMSEPPKDDEITIPSDDVMRQLTVVKLFPEEYKAWVKQTAVEGLTGYSGLLWWSQMRWMINAGKSHQLDEAIASLHGLDVTYLACTHPGNGVVAQSAAAEWWTTRVPSLKGVDVYGTHCGYLQNQPEFAEGFAGILAG